jgi:phage repressor protein C with HTH and peptisase S24 domain
MIDGQYRTNPIKQEGKTYLPENRELPTGRGMDAVRKLILEKVDERGTNLAELSRKVGRNHAYFQQFIHRNVPVDLPEKIRGKAAAELGVAEDDLKPTMLKVPDIGTVNHLKTPVESTIAKPNLTHVKVTPADASPLRTKPGADLVGGEDLPVFGTAQGGKGSLIVTNQAVDWVVRPDPLLRVREGYGMIVTGDSMSPAHKSGSTALVNPHLPPRGGDICIFRSHADDGAVIACIKELVRFTDDLWHVKQYEPKKTFTMKRSEWQECHVTVGNYSRR